MQQTTKDAAGGKQLTASEGGQSRGGILLQDLGQYGRKEEGEKTANLLPGASGPRDQI